MADQPDQVEEKSLLTLQDVQSFGGTKKDFQLLEGVDVESASELEFDGSESQNVSQKEIQDFIRSIKLESFQDSCDPNESKNGATSEAEMSSPNDDRTDTATTQTKSKRKKRPLVNKETQEKKATKRVQTIKKDSSKSMDKENTTAAEVPKLHNQVEGRRVNATDSDVEHHLLAISARSYKKLLVGMDAGDPWFVQSATQEPAFAVDGHVLDHLTNVGAELMKSEVQLYEQVRARKRGANDVKWLKTVLSSGTLSDKIATLTLLIQESPVHTLGSLDTLLSMANKKGKRESIMAVDTLKQLWISNLLPEERKLKFLKQRPLNLLLPSASGTQPPKHPALATHPAHSTHQSLLLWYFEDQLKPKYAGFVSTLQALSHDSVAKIREKALGHIFDLLFQRPEQEQVLLSELVNKLGDPTRKVASKAMLFLLKLLNHHVNMKVIVAREIENLLHRPNISLKAQYYGACCLNQIVIVPQDEALAAKLIEIYFTFFKVYIQKKQLDGKMLSALLTGVNRAFPFLKGEIPNFQNHLHSLFKIVHVGPIVTGIQCLMLLFQVMESRQAISRRFYQALYTKLLDPALKHFNRQAMFLNVLFKSLKSDPVLTRVKAFLRRILQVCVFHAPSFVCGCLCVISELGAHLVLRLELSRLSQTHEKMVLKLKPVLWSFILQPEEADEECFQDVAEDGEDAPKPHSPPAQDPVATHLSPPVETVGSRAEAVPSQEEPMAASVSAIGQRDEGNGRAAVSRKGGRKGQQYYANRRNPLYCGAEYGCLWELGRLTCHYHPSVQRFAQKIASGELISYSGDALQDFTLMRFLDRFVYKNPKQKESDHGGSLMQRASKLTLKTEIPVNSAQFTRLDETKVRDDEVFLHRYFRQKVVLEASSKKSGEKEKEGAALVEGAGDEHQDIYLQGVDMDMDFAAELEMHRTSLGKRRRGTEEEGSSLGGSDREQDSGNEFDYDAMDFEEDEGVWGVGGGKGGVSEAQLEKMLLENLSSNEEEEEGEKGPAKKKRKKQASGKANFDPSSLFAAADEFADILEESGSKSHQTKDNASEKQLWWEERQGQPVKYSHKMKKKKGPKKPKDKRDRGRGRDGRTGFRNSKQERTKQLKRKKKGKGVKQQGKGSKKDKK